MLKTTLHTMTQIHPVKLNEQQSTNGKLQEPENKLDLAICTDDVATTEP